MTKTIRFVRADGSVVLAGEAVAPHAATAKVVNYTPEQEAEIIRYAEKTESGKLGAADAAALAELFNKTVKSVVAKLSRMGVYQKKEYATKTGAPVVKKDEHADAIGAILRLTEAETDSLTKANKTALQKIFEALANSKPIEG
jgi:ATP-dependent protease HslVU (ClpYQ) peptidase subunit